jgi:hypothetical protein
MGEFRNLQLSQNARGCSKLLSIFAEYTPVFDERSIDLEHDRSGRFVALTRVAITHAPIAGNTGFSPTTT